MDAIAGDDGLRVASAVIPDGESSNPTKAAPSGSVLDCSECLECTPLQGMTAFALLRP